jgi:hypothetical protein
VSAKYALTPYAIQPSGRVYVQPGFFYLVDTSAFSGNVTFLLPPAASCEPGARWKIKKESPDANGIAVTPWGSENINGATTPQIIATQHTSHEYAPGCPAAYGTGTVSW